MARAFTPQRRMEKEWSVMAAVTANLTATGVSAGSGGLGFTRSGTILRILAEYTIWPTAVTVSQDAAFITVGIGIISTDAAAVGSTTFPDPFTELSFPWLYVKTHALGFPAATSGTAGEGPQGV